ncbi:NAD(P)H-hydrate dehydratase [Telmatospirillum sp.]|uniref:NAD(P)H-hydrate dehydratase n=1 Tax=Telmatospirillum sp. TaxID=2079197 RepID=UPI00284CAEB4|nr:NAD(P)H-hydrate dehydratase [Telmatospirillum sp.]MDR3435851.1 NAD(P)H-hydrate dehydratase [Telmatospirillum sp.]
MHSLLSTAEMYAADQAAMAAGVAGEVLMEAAGWQIAMAVRRNFTPRPVLVLCGPGNNGGDGFVAARLLDAWGWPVRLFLLGSGDRLTGDAAVMAGRWRGQVETLTETISEDGVFECHPLIIDALFGAGLARPLDGIARAVVEAINARHLDVVAVDVPSGIDGNSGEVRGVALMACLTVTFFRAKPGHVLFPGRRHCGSLVIGDIGIPNHVLAGVAPKTYVNVPALWRDDIPWPRLDGHKYDRGHLLVAGGGTLCGAARLAARAGRRAGAGLATVVAPDAVLPTYRADWPGTMVLSISSLDLLLEDRRVTAAVLGPGLGVGEQTAALVSRTLVAGKRCVLDADALTSFAGRAADLWRLGGNPVLTPHDGEFARLFGNLLRGDRLSRARAAAAASGAVVVLKGPDTVVASPDGRAAITTNAPPDLATGGTGDVLSGLIGGLLAQGMDSFGAACLGAWLHGQAARIVGPGLLAEDLIGAVPAVWRMLSDERSPSSPARAERLDARSRRTRGPIRTTGSQPFGDSAYQMDEL